jgi:D-beta-D-heptose 7-phosphate kinase/D-beta-D-heptose 1-phosphate adenosyltransferase
MTIAVIGDYILDEYITGKVERISPESPIPIFKEVSYECRDGGSGNVVANLQALGAEVDHYFDVTNHAIKKRYVCDNHLVFRSDNEQYTINNDVDYLDLTGIEYCVLSDYNKGYLHYTHRIITRCKSFGCKVIVDPKKRLENYIGADIVKLNQKELVDYTDKEDYQNSPARMLYKYQIGALVVTRGRDGVSVYTKDSTTHIKGDEHSVSDVTGAGDVFIASMTYYLSLGDDLVMACTKANKLAGLSVTKFGTYVLTQDDIRRVKTVFTNGCFDILHRGHIELLRESKKLGGRLVVGLNSDESVRRLKGNDRPVNKQEDRKALLESLESVDEVVIFDADTPRRVIENLRPDVITKGGDYTTETVVGNDLAEVVIIPLVGNLSTTSIIEKLR